MPTPAELKTLAKESLIRLIEDEDMTTDEQRAEFFMNLQLGFMNEVVVPMLNDQPQVIVLGDGGNSRELIDQMQTVLGFLVEKGWMPTIDVADLNEFHPTMEGRHVHLHHSDVNGHDIVRFAIEADHDGD